MTAPRPGRWWTYPLRRFARWLQSPEMACDYRWCARPRVGIAVWCREHTDRILDGEQTADWPRRRGARQPWPIGSDQ